MADTLGMTIAQGMNFESPISPLQRGDKGEFSRFTDVAGHVRNGCKKGNFETPENWLAGRDQ
jgi:hypothetical protein